jgi:hypothetical protein
MKARTKPGSLQRALYFPADSLICINSAFVDLYFYRSPYAFRRELNKYLDTLWEKYL